MDDDIDKPVSLISSIKRNRAFQVIASLVAIVGLLLIAIPAVRHVKDAERRNQILILIFNRTLVPDADGIVIVPPSLRGSTYDKVYVSADTPDRTWILFPTWRGKGRNLVGYLYCSVPNSMTAGVSIPVLVPSEHPDPPTVMIEVNVDQTHGPNLSTVSYRLD